MFRVFCYFDSVRFTSDSFDDKATADSFLEKMISCGATGGDVEELVLGVGWVLIADVEEASSKWRQMGRALPYCGGLDKNGG